MNPGGIAEPVPFPPIFVDGQMVNHADLVNEVLGRLYRIEMAQYRLERMDERLQRAANSFDTLLAIAKMAWEWRQPSHDGGMGDLLRRMTAEHPGWQEWA